MLQPGLHGAEHLHPAAAIAIGRFKADVRLAPTLLSDGDERSPIVQRLEPHRDGRVLSAGRIIGAVVGRPLQDDAAVLLHLHDFNRKRARKGQTQAVELSG